jgi:hypothetical protein
VSSRFRVQGLVFRVYGKHLLGIGFRVKGLFYRGQGSGFIIQGLRFKL